MAKQTEEEIRIRINVAVCMHCIVQEVHFCWEETRSGILPPNLLQITIVQHKQEAGNYSDY